METRGHPPIRNPILPGFHPDPSIVRVGDDYYIATSTFEWFPGVRLHHSRDLLHWRPIGHALTRQSQIDLRGSPRSGGVRGPCLSHARGRFHLVYAHVKTRGLSFDDTHSSLVTSESVEGPWSEPVLLSRTGFDSSLFTDEDERQWLVNVVWDYRPRKGNLFGGIALQEYDRAAQALVGEPRIIFKGTSPGLIEGPHLYRRGGYYYLMVAEAGTGCDHAVTVARSKSLEGPYERGPGTPLLTSRDAPDTVLQKAGHGSLVETPTGEWYLAHLVGRPVGSHRRSVLGRETALQKVEWTTDGWLSLVGGGHLPLTEVPAPGLAEEPFEPEAPRDDFDRDSLGPQYQTLRVPPDESWLSLRERPGFLRLRGRESPKSSHRQSLVARRFQSFHCRFQTCVEFEPTSFQQLAGLMCLYDDQNFYYAHVSHDEELGICLTLFENRLDVPRELLEQPISLETSRIHLRADYHETLLYFSYSLDGTAWTPLGHEVDATILADEHTTFELGCTGAFGAVAAHDMSGAGAHADFDYFEYRNLEPPAERKAAAGD